MGLGIEWVGWSCRLLAAIGEEFERTRPFDGLRIGTGIHVEPKTVALLLTLARGGAEVVSTGNLNTTQQEAVDYLNAHGVRAIGGPTADPIEHDGWLREVLATEPQLLLDNGGDLFTRWLDAPWDGLVGGTEETTSGRMRLEPLRERIGLPVLVINDSPIKQFAENRHAVGQSTVEAYLRITNRSTNGKRVTVFGYGACGRGIAAHFRNAFADVSVVEIDPVVRLEALLDGFAVPDRAAALGDADVVITATGARDVITAADLPHFADDTVLFNVGHFPHEIDVPGIAAAAHSRAQAADGIETLELDGGRRVHLLTGGHMVNLAGPRPLGNSIESMDLGFALQARCLEAVALGRVGRADCVVPVPRAIDEAVAAAYVAFANPGTS
jgi:adenosylhomocysteinase